jgi:cytochrome c
MSKLARAVLAVTLLAAATGNAAAQAARETPRNYGIGHVASAEQIAGWDIDIRPDGQGAPSGRGSVRVWE